MEKPKIGTRWQEDYEYAHPRVVEVVGYADDGRIIIRGPSGRRTKAKVERFGRPGGYLPVPA